MRRQPPNRRRCTTRSARVGSQKVHVTFGWYEDGALCEVFLDVSKQGTALRQWTSTVAVLASIALQHGASPECVAGAIASYAHPPDERVEGCDGISGAKGVLEFLAKVIALEGKR